MTDTASSSETVYHRYGLQPLINARGCATIVGGTIMSDEVVAAYAEAARSNVSISSLQAVAGRVIAGHTGAESGYVTTGAFAGLTMAAAAVIAGLDVDAMDSLPDTGTIAAGIVMQRCHRNQYQRALALAGAEIIEFGSDERTEEQDMRACIERHRTVAAFFNGQRETAGLRFRRFVAIAHDLGVKVIVDASMSLPPAENLRKYVSEGADIVAFSGGKSIMGPQSTGFIAADKRIVESMALQTQDMDVDPATWERRGLLDRGVLPRVPAQGLGRGFKVGKEDVVALLVALDIYASQPHDRIRQERELLARQLVEQLSGITGLESLLEPADTNGRPVPAVRLTVVESQFGMNAISLVHCLSLGRPPIAVNDYDAHKNVVRLDTEVLHLNEVPTIVERLKELGRR